MGDRIGTICRAIEMFSHIDSTDVLAVSDFYETDPVGGVAKNLFINACVLIDTLLSPHELMRELLAIERELGRTRDTRWEDRTCDLDLLMYNESVVEDPDCTVPHPYMTQRAFVMIPLVQIAPDLVHPVYNLTVAELTRTLSATEWAGVRRIEKSAPAH